MYMQNYPVPQTGSVLHRHTMQRYSSEEDYHILEISNPLKPAER